MIKHIVMWKFKENTEKEMYEFLDKLKELENIIPEIEEMQTGVSVNPKNTYDAVLISVFKNLEDLEKYKIDPRHVAVSNLCKSIRTERGAIDIEF